MSNIYKTSQDFQYELTHLYERVIDVLGKLDAKIDSNDKNTRKITTTIGNWLGARQRFEIEIVALSNQEARLNIDAYGLNGYGFKAPIGGLEKAKKQADLFISKVNEAVAESISKVVFVEEMIQEGLLCPTCGKLLQKGTRFCPDDGTPIAKDCPACNNSNAPGAQFCSNCGKKI